jgi:ribosomal protein L18
MVPFFACCLLCVSLSQTNRDVVCQIFSSDIKHDVCIASAYSHELKRYGLTVGLTNYAAAYATGLLLARRIDAKFSIGYKGNMLVDGKEFHVKDDGEGAAPFRALLDVGLARTTTGARVFGALKGSSRIPLVSLSFCSHPTLPCSCSGLVCLFGSRAPHHALQLLRIGLFQNSLIGHLISINCAIPNLVGVILVLSSRIGSHIGKP